MLVRSVDGKIIGDIDNGVFTKKVNGQIHMLRKPLAWAIDAEAYKKEIQPSCHTIVVIDTHANLIYSVSRETFDDKKAYMNRGYGGQFFLILKHWRVQNQAQGTIF